MSKEQENNVESKSEFNIEPVLLRAKEVGKMLNVSISTIYKLRDNDPHFPKSVDLKVVSMKLYKKEDVEKYAQSLGYVEK